MTSFNHFINSAKRINNTLFHERHYKSTGFYFDPGILEFRLNIQKKGADKIALRQISLPATTENYYKTSAGSPAVNNPH